MLPSNYKIQLRRIKFSSYLHVRTTNFKVELMYNKNIATGYSETSVLVYRLHSLTLEKTPIIARL
jgi:hypothetical protein